MVDEQIRVRKLQGTRFDLPSQFLSSSPDRYFVRERERHQLAGPAATMIKYSACEELGLHLPGVCDRVWD